MEPEWLTEAEVLKILKVSRQTLYNLRMTNRLPFFKVGGRCRYLTADIDAFVLNRNTPQLQNQAESKIQSEHKKPESEPNKKPSSSSDDDYFI